MAVGDGGKVGDKDRIDSVGAGGALQASRSEGAAIWDQYMGGDGGHIKITIGIPLSGSQKD